ncbi:MAG: hypothetical protein IT363_08895 [Methanoregulaceae archaeon]|jgi:hypothetical protein|nr:hypothetical protein [Methanoregulaceae archaeon]
MHTKQPVEVDASKGYEQSDLPMRDIRIGMIGLVVMAVFGIIATPPIMRFIDKNSVGPKKAEHYELRTLPVEPNPALQDNATNHTDTVNLRRREHERMTTEGIDPQTGRRYIPIDQALAEEAARSGR